MIYGPIRFALSASLALCVATPALAAEPPAPSPPDPSSLAALSAYGALPGIEDMAISPDGKAFALIARIAGERRIVIMDAAQHILTSAPIGDTKLRGIRWASPRVAIAITSNTQNLGPGFLQDKLELWGAIRLSLDGQKTEMIFARDSSMAHAIWGDFGSRAVDGKLVGFFSGVAFQPSGDRLTYIFDHGRPGLYQVDLISNNSKRRVAEPAGQSHYRDWLVDGGGQVAATLDVSSNDGNWRILNQRGTTIASGKNLGGKVGLIAFGKDGTSVVYSETGSEDGERRWFEVPLAGGTAQEILPGIKVERAFIDPTNGRLLGYLQDGAPPRPVLFDPAQQAAVAKVYRAFPKLDVRIAEWTPDFGKFLVHTSGNGDSGTWYVVDMAVRRADPLGTDYPVIQPENVGPISTVAYKAGDGLQLDGVLSLPPGRPAHNLPVVILPHGGPHAYDRASFDWWAQAFASRGYAVFQPNFRGSTNRDDEFMRAGYGQWGRKMQTDLSDGLAELARQGIVDPKRACIVGASYGGYAALAGVTLQKGLYRCAVAVAGVSDLSDMYWTDFRESGGNRMLKRNLTESLGAPATFAEVSPRKHARDADAPILLIHGKDDTVVPFGQSTAMADALRDAGKPVEFVTLREEDHWLSRTATRQQMLEAAVGFVAKHNPAN